MSNSATENRHLIKYVPVAKPAPASLIYKAHERPGTTSEGIFLKSNSPIFSPVSAVVFALAFAGTFALAGCKQAAAPAQAAGAQALPVQTVAVSLSPVPQSSEYVATIKSRRSATLQPQVDGRLTTIHARSGDHVQAGQVLMTIDPLHQQATLDAQRSTELQKKAVLDYNTREFDRQKKLFDAGITSRDVYEQWQQSYENAKADYDSSVATRRTQEEQLAYYTIRAPFDGVVGDIPVHIGDYVSATTVLTTVDENKDLEAYIYVPTERSTQLKQGLEVDLTDTNGTLLEKTSIDFLSPQVDSTVQGVLVKAPVHSSLQVLRTAQLVKARIVWNTQPMATVPVLAVSRLGGQSFVYVAKQQNGHFIATQTPVTLGDTVGNNYAITNGLSQGDKVIVSSTQMLVNGMPVMPLGS
jgi:RND family efflux transporter MFP subunit